MKKFLFATILFASTTFGFAKDIVQNSTSNDKNLVKTEIFNGKEVKTYRFNSLEEAQKFLENCTDITIATQMIEQPDGSFEEEVISMCETTYPCVSGGIRAYLIRL